MLKDGGVRLKMDDNFIFTGGKYNGKTYAWVMENNPQYVSWCKDNYLF